MDQQQQQQAAQTTTTTSQSTEPQPPSQPPQSQTQEQTPPPPPSSITPAPSSSASSTTTTTTSTPTLSTNAPNPNPNPTTAPKPTALAPPPPRPASFSRPWQQPPLPPPQQQQHFSHFSSLPSTSSSSSSASPSSSASATIPASSRGGIAIGVPASRPSVSSPQPAPPFSSSFGQQFGGLASNSVSTSSPMQVRSPGMQGMGVMGSLGSGSGSQIRAGGISVQHHHQRPVQQSSLRPLPPSPNSQSPAAQNFQGQGLMRVSPVGSPGSPSPTTSQGVQSFNQPWLSSGSQGKPPLPPPSAYRPPMSTPSMQQRSHIPQQPSPLSATSQQQHASSVQPQQSKPSHPLQEHYGQQFSSSRVPQSLSHQQQITRPQVSAIQKPSSIASLHSNAVQPGIQNKIASAESDEIGHRILSKRTIHELVNQIDPSERLDPEVEDILVDIAEDFVESITTFGCSLAKHRKSDTLEAKDILLHLERNWNMTLPGFSGDEIKTYRKPLTSDIHKERLAAIKKSVMAIDVPGARTSVGQAAVNTKGNLGKMSASIGST